MALALAFAGESRASDRAPSDAEYRELISAIGLIHKVGYKKIAEKLGWMLTHDALLVFEPRDPFTEALTSFPAVGQQRIYVSKKVIPDLRERKYSLGRRFGELTLLEERVWLASLLVHEWFHTDQDYWFIQGAGRIEINREYPAWEFQRQFLEDVLKFHEGKYDRQQRSRIEGNIDRCEAEMDSVGTNHKIP